MLRSVRLARSASRDLRLTCGSVVRLGGSGQDGGVQVRVPIDEAAVHSCAARHGRDADFLAVDAEVVEGFQNTTSATGGVVPAGSGERADR